MRHLVLVAFICGFIACSKSPSYNIEINLRSAEGKAYLSQRVKGEWVKLDSTDFVDGKCQFSCVVKNPDMYYLNVGNRKDRLGFFVENSEIKINGVIDSLSFAKVSGSTVQDEFKALQDKLDELDKQGTEFFEKSKAAEKAGDKANADSLMALAEKTFETIDKQQKDYIKANPASYISPYLLSRVHYEMEAAELENFLSALDSKLDSMPAVLTLEERVKKLQSVAIGQIAPDFTMNDLNGNPVKLSDIYSKNEYTLVDFWASWCGPCRRENPNVVATFNQYKNKGFGVFGVSLDTDKAKWEKAIADNQLAWPHVSDLKGWKNEAAALYAVNSIPANLLLDKTGKIVARNLREEKLPETINGLLK